MVWRADGLAAVVNDYGVATVIERDANGSPTAIVAPQGSRTRLGTLKGRLAIIEDPTGGDTHLAYDDSGRLTGLSDPVGGHSTFAYSVDGSLLSSVDGAGQTTTIGRSATADGFRLATTSSLARSATDTIATAADGTLTHTLVDVAGRTWMEVLTPTGRTLTGPGRVTAAMTLAPDPTWGAAAPVVASLSIKDPSGAARTLGETRVATPATDGVIPDVVRTRVVDGTTTRIEASPSAHTLRLSFPDGTTRVTTLDAQGNPLRVDQSGLASIVLGYDSRGRPTSETIGAESAARTWTLAYDDVAGTAAVTDPSGVVTRTRVDAAGRVVALSLPGGGTATVAYDGLGRPTGITTPGGGSHALTWRPDGTILLAADPGTASGTRFAAATYDKDGLSLALASAGSSVALTRDAAGRVATVDAGAGTATYTYDPVSGALTGVANAGETIAQAFDGLDLVHATWSGEVAGAVDVSLDAAGRVSGEQVSGTSVRYGYDPAGRLVQTGDATVDWTGDNGLPSAIAAGGTTTVLTWDDAGRPLSERTSSGSTTTYALTVARDAFGRVLTRTEQVGSEAPVVTAYTYDAAGRLSSWHASRQAATSVRYDADGNIVAVTGSSPWTATYDAGDTILKRSGVPYAFDGFGRVSSIGSGSTLTTIKYDALGRLLGVAPAGKPAIGYVVDGLGRRVGKTAGGTVTRGWLYGPDGRPTAELDGSGAVVARFAYIGASGAPATMTEGGRTYLLVSDDLGSVRLVVDSATGAIAQRLDYDAWGRVTADSAPGFQPFGFAGGLYDPDTGFVHLGVRDYDPSTGRWLAPDPIGFGGGDTNLYRYVADLPTSATDRTGLSCDVATLSVSGSAFVWYGHSVEVGLVNSASGYGNSASGWGAYWNIGDGVGLGYGANLGATCLDQTPEGAARGQTPLDQFKGDSETLDGSLGPVNGGQDWSKNLSGWHAGLGLGSPFGAHYGRGDTHVITPASGFAWLACKIGDCSKPPPIDDAPPPNSTPPDTAPAGVCTDPTSCSDTLGDQFPPYTPEPCSDDCGSSFGDPHLITLDGLRYDFQAAGEFVAVKAASGDLEIQVRQESLSESIKAISMNTAIAMNVAGDRVGMYRVGGIPTLFLNGKATQLPGPLPLPHGGLVTPMVGGFRVTWPDGSSASLPGGTTGLYVQLASGRKGAVTGLLGNFDGRQDNDLQTRDGHLVLNAKGDYHIPLYAEFGESWRVSQGDSLFDDLPGQDVARYANRQIPSSDATTSLEPARRDAAAALCAALGVTDPAILAACILDVGLTGNPLFGQAALTAQVAVGTPGSGTAGGSGKTTAVTVPTDVSGALGVAGAADRYTFIATAGMVLFLSSSSCPATPLHWSLLGPDGEPVPGTTSPGVCTAIGRAELPLDGQYTVVVTAPADLSAVATYALDIRMVAPDDVFSISVGDDVSFNHPKPGMGYLESAGIHHRYVFTAPSSGVVELDTASICGQDLSWTLADASGHGVGSALPQCTSFGKVTLAPGAVYTITIAGADPASLGVGQYGFTLGGG